jgi:hypothetical protein
VMEVPCTDCNFEDCQNKLMPQVAAARASSLIPSQDGLFAVQAVDAGTLVASFGPVNRVNRKGRPKLGYKIPIRETGTRRVEWVTPCNGGSSEYKAHSSRGAREGCPGVGAGDSRLVSGRGDVC